MRQSALALAGLMLLWAQAASADGRTWTPATWRPLPASPPTAQVARLRDDLLGPHGNAAQGISLWWVGVSSYIINLQGHLLLLDAWEPVGLHKDYVPIGREELAALQPEAILIGHGHFDHAADAGFVAGRSGAVVVGSEEVCATAREDATADDMAGAVDCLVLGNADTRPSTRQWFKLFEDTPPVAAVTHLHSSLAREAHDPAPAFFHKPNLRPFITHFNTDWSEYRRFFASLLDPMGGAWAYYLSAGELGLFWHDSSGNINTGSHPHAEEVQAALDSFAGCVDIQLGAIVGFNQLLNGLRDPRLYMQHLRPALFIPGHHDAWIPIMGGGARAYESRWREQMERVENPPRLDYLRDPEDYLAPRHWAGDLNGQPACRP